MSVELVGLPGLKRNFTYLEKEVLPTAASQALNRTMSRMQTVTVRSLAKRMGLKQKEVRDRVVVHRAKRETSPSASMEISGKPLNLIHFGARQNKKGVSAKAWGTRRTYPHTFIATVRGNRLVMKRRKRGESRVPRLPIDAVVGPGVANEANDPDAAKERAQIVSDFLPPELERLIQYHVKGRLK